jgi:hypothetical protein
LEIYPSRLSPTDSGDEAGFAYGLWGNGAIFFMGAHAERGVQIESLWASIQIISLEFGQPGKVYFSAGCYNLSNSMEGVFKCASHIAAILVTLWGALLARRLAVRGKPLVVAVATVLGGLILVSKVFSPQYILFFLPVLTLALEFMPLQYRRVTVGLTIGYCLLTTWVYPYHEKELTTLLATATVPLIMRNALFGLSVILLMICAWKHLGKTKMDANIILNASGGQ